MWEVDEHNHAKDQRIKVIQVVYRNGELGFEDNYLEVCAGPNNTASERRKLAGKVANSLNTTEVKP